MKMYLHIVVVCSALVLVSCEPPAELDEMFEKCGKEIGPPEDVLKEPKNYDDPKVKCFAACLMKKYGSMVDGKVVVGKIVQYAEKYLPGGATNSVKADIAECAGKANESKDDCDVAGAFEKCFAAKHPPSK